MRTLKFSGMRNTSKQRKVGYLLKTFPKLSETFILNEIVQVEQLGTPLHLFSIKRPPAQERFHPGVHQVQANVTYLSSISLRKNIFDSAFVALDHVELFLRNPINYIAALRFHFGPARGRRLKEFIQSGFLTRALQRRGITHLHAHFANVPASMAELVRRFSGITYSFTAHAKDIYLSPKRELSRKMRDAEFVLTCTGYNQRYLEAINVHGTPIHLAYHGVDLDRFLSLNTKRDSDDALHIVSVGRFCEKKGFAYLIQACSHLKARGLPFRCSIVGWGPLRDGMASQIAELSLQAEVRLRPEMTQTQLIEFYRTGDIFVLPCILTDDGDRDGIPNVLLEAMAMQLPAVSTEVSGIPELVEHMESGLLVAEKDALALADALQLLLERPELRKKFGENGRAKVMDQFELKRSARRVHAFLSAVNAPPPVGQVEPDAVWDLAE